MHLDGKPSIEAEKNGRLPSTAVPCKDGKDNLKPVDKKNYKLKHVPKEYLILDFAKAIEGITYNPGFGYGFYDFIKPEIIQYDKQVILMDEVCTYACHLLRRLVSMHS
jgi:hypothetical protein